MTDPKRLTRRERLALAGAVLRGLFGGLVSGALHWFLDHHPFC